MGEGFESLEVWKKGCRLTVDIYEALKGCKDFGFKDQICRAAVSVPSNLAEGYERNSPGDFARFINIAKGSAGELRTQLYIGRELGFIDTDSFNRLLEESKHISAMLGALGKKVSEKR